MGRHSADGDEGEDDLAGLPATGTATLDSAAPAGRHAASDDGEARAAADTGPADQPGAVLEPAVATGDRTESGTRADLRLLRRDSAVRARCLAAVVVSFLLYTLVMVIVGRTDRYLFWLWIPIVLSGVLVGTVLDLAQRAAGSQTAPDERSSAPADEPLDALWEEPTPALPDEPTG